MVRFTWVLFLVGIMLSCGCQGKTEKIQKLSASGKAYFDEGKFQEAVIQYKNVVQQDPESSEGYYQLGRCYLQMKNPVEAFKAFKKAVDLDPTFRDAELQLGNLSLLFGDLKTAEAMGKAMIEQKEGDWEGWVLLARVAMLEKDNEKAEEALATAEKQAPQEILPKILQGRLLERKGKIDEAGALYEKLWKQFPESFEVESTLYQYYAVQGKQDEFMSLAERNLPREAHRSQRLPFLASLYLKMGIPREAAVACSLAVDDAPEDPNLRMLAGKVFLAKGDLQEAEKQWKKGLELDEKNVNIRAALAELYLRKKQLREAETLALKTLDQDPGNLHALVLMGRVRLLDKKYSEAQKFFQDALERSPNNAVAHYFLGLCYANSGQKNLAIKNLMEALEENPSMGNARKALGELYLQEGELQLAEELLAPLVQEKKADKDTVILFSEILRRRGKPGEAMVLLESEETSYPLDKAFPLQKGRIRLTMKDPEGAAQFFQDVLKLDPTSQEAVFRMAQILLQREGPEQTVAWIESRLPDMEDKAPFYNLLGKIALRQGNTQEAEQYLKRALEADPNLLDGYLSLASLYVKLKTREKALQIAQDLEKKKPDSPVGPMLQGMILESMGKGDQAISKYENVMEMRPDFGPAANNLAYLYLEERKDPQKALGLAEKARKQLPDNPAVADTLGWVYEKMGLHHKALNLFLEASEQMPNHPTIYYHLGVAYASSGKKDLARKNLGKALAISGNFPEAQAARKLLETLNEDG